MAVSLTEETLRDFAASLAAKEPVPGGGGAAAYAGALGIALAAMTGVYTVGKRSYAEHEADIRRLLARAEHIRVSLVDLVERDAEAFSPLAAAYAIPKDDPARAEALEAATKQAAEVPLEVMRQICLAIEVLEEMGQRGSRMLLSDVGCGAYLCRAALEAASLNVYVNTTSLADRSFAEAIESECDEMLASYIPRAEACAKRVSDSIQGRK